MLEQARRQRDSAATQAASIVTAATATAPPAGQAPREELPGASDALARTPNPTDPGNSIHPAAFVDERAGAGAARDAAGAAVDNARPPGGMRCAGDPVDTASGNMILPQTDIELPGTLPLRFDRTHVSAYRTGRWFGRSWASTVDQRIEVDAEGVLYLAPDGVVLYYPHPQAGPVLPEHGARWPLARSGDGGYTVTDPDTGRVLRFEQRINDCYPITSVADRNGQRIAFGYTEDGAPSEIVHDGGYRLRLSTTDGRVTALSLLNEGQEVVLAHYGYTDGDLTEVHNSSGEALRFGYDADGRIVEWTDRNGGWYRYRYDADGRCVQVDGPDGYLSGRFDYDPANRVTVHTDALGARTRLVFDERLRLITETDPLGNTTHLEWDSYGRPLSRTDPTGRVSRYEYGPATTGPVALIRPDGTRTSIEYGPPGQPRRTVTPDGAVWSCHYDEAGNRIAVTDPTGARTQVSYDGRGHVRASTDALGNVTAIETNPAGLPITVTDPRGAITRYHYDGFGRLVERVDPVGGVTTMGWTVEGLLAWRSDPNGDTEQFGYDGEGNLVEHIDEIGQVTRDEYTHFDLIAARTTPDGARWEFGYDRELRLTSVTNPAGLVWRYHYDPAGRTVAETDFNGRQLRYDYDPAGRLARRVNGAGEITEYRYDALGNLVERMAGGQLARFGYDRAGRLTYAVNPDAELTFTRDPAGRVLRETVNGREVHTRYDAAGHRVYRRVPSGAESGWTYDPTGNPAALQCGGHQLTFHHDPAGRETQRTLDEVFTLTQRWDHNHRLATQTLLGPTPSALQQRAFHYRPDGALHAVEDQLSGPRRFELDPAGRVTAVHGTRDSEYYTYDPAGNLTYAGWPTTEPDTAVLGPRDYAGGLLTRAGNTQYWHDPQGRMIARRRRQSTTDQLWRYAFNAEDQLTGVTTPDGTHWRYHYDPLGRRINKQRLSPDATTIIEQIDFTWDTSTLAEQIHYHYGIVTWDYHPHSNQPLAQTEHIFPHTNQESHDQRFYAIITDLIGTPTELINTHGTLAWQHTTTFWGTPVHHTPHQTWTPLRFPGQYHDLETGLHYNHYRYYDPTTARYTTQDPLGLAPNPNTYVHNPHTCTDPHGLAPCVVGPYHGTSEEYAKNIRNGGIDLSRQRPDPDIGRGFYLTNNPNQALTWIQQRHPGNGAMPHHQLPANALPLQLLTHHPRNTTATR
jgi:RHS repeat-associated protein